MAGHSQFELLRTRRFLPFFLTQALGAFNDNVFKNALVILIAFKIAGLTSADINFWSNLAAGLFILPFFLFSASAGQWAERQEKSSAIRKIKLLEVLIMMLAAVGFWLNSLPFLIGVLFLMGTQSTLFGPIKYSALPQILKPEELVGGNGLIEAGTFLTILLGTLLGGWLMAGFEWGATWVSMAVIGFAVAGWLSSRAIPPLPATANDIRIDPNVPRAILNTLGQLRGNRAVLNSVLGISWFWFFGSIFLAQLPNYTKEYLGGDESVAPMVLTLFSLGIGLGSLLCEKLSSRTVEIGLVPLGALGLTVFGVDLYFARPEAASVSGLDWRAFLDLPGNLRIAIDLALIGFFGGFYIVPLYALVQQRCPREKISRVIAANNILNALFMVVASVMAIILLNAGLNIPQLLLITAILNAIVAIYIFSLVPEFAMRFLVWIAVNLLYRVKVEGIEEHVPDEGPALLVCNHVSFVDALVLGGAVPRPVRFVMYYKIHRLPILGWIFRTAKTIPIAGSKEDPELMQRAFEAVEQALKNGEIVGIFPEGGLTRDGEMAPFRPGVERILAKTPVPVVPLAITGLWRSMWSRRDSLLGRMRLPRRLRARIGVRAAPALPPNSSAAELEAKVRELRGDLQ
ncbi:MFS transporter [Pseudomarimonas arenosa]|uniref:MFS transporter n=1 Tax=Pseudomarimonas arenosa TaxID=2774145 RepID=A0AAW3ZKE6_9GAMM|nr:MFS transporter [Pseudomarimonas arenosa]MBD8524936.1 MFS transporter [Pseudomarimonas arenosa]